MDLTSHLSKALSRPSSAREILGSDHPLTRVLALQTVLLEHSVAVALLLAGAVVELGLGAAWALHAAVGAATALALLAAAALLLCPYKRELVLDLIIGGRGNLALPAIERQRRRLLRPRTRTRLAARIEHVIEDAHMSPARPPVLSPKVPINVIAVASLAGELRAITVLLRGAPKDARAVALIERLLEHGGSGLYRGKASTLREDVQRVRFLLS